MQNKQSLRIDKAFSNEIVKIRDSYSCYVDQDYFRDVMNEDILNEYEYNSFPVKIVAVEIGWILSEKNGIKFLEALLGSENIDTFEIPAIKMIITYLYNTLKNKATRQLLTGYFI